MKALQKKLIASIALTMAFLLGQAAAQLSHVGVRPLASNVIVPQSRARAFAPERPGQIEITRIAALVDILESTAVTTIEIQLQNTGGRREEAELIVPVPDGAVVRGFAYDGPGGEITAQVLPKDEAKRIYQQLVSKIRDPALVEFVGYNLIRSSVFPVEAHGKQKVRLTYENLLEVDGNRIDYILPRTESLKYSVPWDIKVTIKSKRPISTVYSPTHKLIGMKELDLESMHDRNGAIVVTVQTEKGTTEPGPFRLSYLLQENGVTASMFAYPDNKVAGGYFLLLGGLPADVANADDNPAIKREITLVIDRSGSMRNEKIEQVKEAALQIIAGLKQGEAFNVCIYNETVEWFSGKPVPKNKENEEAARKYIEGITATGGTNIYDALQQALAQEPTEGTLAIVLFLTDGLPTVGYTSEVVIRELVEKSNPHKRRVFTFGVGVDVNAPLLDKIAALSRAKAEYVLPKEDVEVKIGRVFKRLTGPVLADIELQVVKENGEPAVGRTRDILPDKLPDMFEGDQLVLLGQYVGKDDITFKISGNYLGKKRSFKFTFEFDKANVRNGFVPRLWASRKIAQLIDEVRQMGADPAVAAADPKLKELTDEIVRLSTEFGILTEYTAFLAREGTDLHDVDAVAEETAGNLHRRAMEKRDGLGAVNQSFNYAAQSSQQRLNMDNSFIDENFERVTITNVQQINDTAYYQRGRRWVDSRLVNNEKEIQPARTIEFGSEEFIELAQKLAKSNRQGSIALRGDILLMVEGEPILVRSPVETR
ncbi:MAG TPA: VIT and VWA domain-containing protein [Sedimentisphaerales bacterium]|nr:VIT and VWA domain-containing protein [Sedimentisphaerales bacterium]